MITFLLILLGVAIFVLTTIVLVIFSDRHLRRHVSDADLKEFEAELTRKYLRKVNP